MIVQSCCKAIKKEAGWVEAKCWYATHQGPRSKRRRLQLGKGRPTRCIPDMIMHYYGEATKKEGTKEGKKEYRISYHNHETMDVRLPCMPYKAIAIQHTCSSLLWFVKHPITQTKLQKWVSFFDTIILPLRWEKWVWLIFKFEYEYI